ncbi:MAG: hypothetical protein ACLSA6_08865 [Holdemania massiliensis]
MKKIRRSVWIRIRKPRNVLYGMGVQHIDVILSKLKSKYKIVTTTEPKVQYRETIREQSRLKASIKAVRRRGSVWSCLRQI